MSIWVKSDGKLNQREKLKETYERNLSLRLPLVFFFMNIFFMNFKGCGENHFVAYH